MPRDVSRTVRSGFCGQGQSIISVSSSEEQGAGEKTRYVLRPNESDDGYECRNNANQDALNLCVVGHYDTVHGRFEVVATSCEYLNVGQFLER
jgi:hypothetical protein